MSHPNTPFADGLVAAATDIAEQRRKLNAAWDALQLALQAVHPDLMLSPNGGVMEKTDAWEASDAGNGQVESFKGTAQMAERLHQLQALIDIAEGERDEWREKYHALEAADALVTGALADAAVPHPTPAPLHEPDDPAAAEAERVARVAAEDAERDTEWDRLKRRADAVGVPMMSTPPPPAQFAEVVQTITDVVVAAEDAEGKRRKAEADAARDEAKAAAQTPATPEPETRGKRSDGRANVVAHWSTRSDIVATEQRLREVWRYMQDVENAVPAEVAEGIGARQDRVADDLRTILTDRGLVTRTGKNRYRHGQKAGRASVEYVKTGKVFRDRDGNTWEKSPANPH